MARKKSRTKSKKSSRKSTKAKTRSKAKRAKAQRARHIPAGYHSVTPYLAVRGAAAAIEFYKRVFGAKEKVRFPDGERIAHAEIDMGGSHVMLADEQPSLNFVAPQLDGPSSVGIMLYVTDVDAAVERAVTAGSKVERPVADQFYGDRLGTIVDPYGHRWYVATHVEDVSPAEMRKRMQALKPQS